MDLTREVTAKLAISGKVHVEQKKLRLDPYEWDQGGRRGIIRVRLAASDGDTGG